MKEIELEKEEKRKGMIRTLNMMDLSNIPLERIIRMENEINNGSGIFFNFIEFNEILKEHGIFENNSNKDIYRELTDFLFKSNKDDNLLLLNGIKNNFLTLNDLRECERFNIFDILKTKTSLSTFYLQGSESQKKNGLSTIKGSGNPARGDGEVLFSLLSRNGYLGTRFKERHGDIEFDGLALEIKGKDGRIGGQKGFKNTR